uniref:NADH dehydrogenase subunit 6 n=1 Tax=Brachyrhynchus hsiaoi TaxID=928820 RepID=A0A059P0N5_9HEMI|nr:NADH dehydrogenase subunit 6 [Brachyrhynchus hsiaoi]ADQ64016.1 NADH dehydrogenase subunit 6 [Brachyrhynchus hsiaoi]
MKLIMSILMTTSMMMSMTKTPISKGGTLVLATFSVALMMGYIMSTFMFSYIFIIIMMSGMMVMFMYMAVIMSNNKFKLSITMVLTMVMSMLMCMLINEPQEPSTQNEENHLLVNLVLNWQITMMVVILLLFIMIVTVNMITTNSGPLRMKS